MKWHKDIQGFIYNPHSGIFDFDYISTLLYIDNKNKQIAFKDLSDEQKEWAKDFVPKWIKTTENNCKKDTK